jgi:hypothetical protein
MARQSGADKVPDRTVRPRQLLPVMFLGRPVDASKPQMQAVGTKSGAVPRVWKKGRGCSTAPHD